MKKSILLAALAVASVNSMFADQYSVESSVEMFKSESNSNQFEFKSRVCRLVETDGKVVEEVIASPRMTSSYGTPCSCYVGYNRDNPRYWKSENVSFDVVMPKAGGAEFASCEVVIKRGDSILHKSKVRIQVNSPRSLAPAGPVEPKAVAANGDNTGLKP